LPPFVSSLRLRRPPVPTLFPYTTLFRSCKADGGYVVAPPSVSDESGRLYRWIQKDDLGSLPPHVVGVLTADDGGAEPDPEEQERDRKSTRLNSSHVKISYAVFCLKKKKA